jgi:hypothetical protein
MHSRAVTLLWAGLGHELVRRKFHSGEAELRPAEWGEWMME